MEAVKPFPSMGSKEFYDAVEGNHKLKPSYQSLLLLTAEIDLGSNVVIPENPNPAEEYKYKLELEKNENGF